MEKLERKKICIHGCDNSIIIEMEVNSVELNLLKKLSKIMDENWETCSPKMEVLEIGEECKESCQPESFCVKVVV
jgi:hypothetical protein